VSLPLLDRVSPDNSGLVRPDLVAEHWVGTTCGCCSVGCGMQIGVAMSHAVAVRGMPDHPVNHGLLCPRGLSAHHAIQAADRAVEPLLRRQGAFATISWEQALSTTAKKFRDVQARHGADAVGVISTGQLVTEEFYTLGKLVQLGIGTPNYDGNTTLCMSAAVAGYTRSFGSDGPPAAYEDFEHADVVMLIGANIADNHPILCRRLEANPRATLIVVDPRVTTTAIMADLHLPVRPRSDLALINGLIHLVIEMGLVDHEFVTARTTGYEALRASVAGYTPQRVSELTGLPADVLVRTATIYGEARSALTAWAMGVNHSSKGTETVNAINNLALVTGNIGRSGAGPFSLTGQCNAMGARESGFCASLPGYRPFASVEAREALADRLQVAVERIPSVRGLAYPDILDAALDGRIRALWIIGTNPIGSFPNLDTVTQAFSNLEFLVVQDAFHPTPTSALADLLLPAAAWGEKEGTYTNSERRVGKVNAAVAPPGSARTDFDIFLGLAKTLGVDRELFPGWTAPRDAFNEWRRVSAGSLCDCSGMTYEAIEAAGGIQWPYPTGSTDAEGTRRLYEDGRFQTSDGRARLIPTAWQPHPEQPTREFPFILNTGRAIDLPILDQLPPRAWVEMNPRDADALGLTPQQSVDVVSRRGCVRGAELRLTETVAAGQVFVPFHRAEGSVNRITQSAFDPISREPNYKQSAVRVEAADRTPGTHEPAA